MKYLYRYPQREFPYRDLLETNRGRTKQELEYELLDTGAFEDDRYFDVFLEYAKEGPEDILIKVSVHNRGKEAARLHLLPTLWFRNTWSWGDEGEKPVLRENAGAIVASHPELGEYTLSCGGKPELLFTENESNAQKLWDQPNPTPYVSGASHQTGWTGLVARLLDLFGRVTAQDALETPKEKLDARLVRQQVGGE